MQLAGRLILGVLLAAAAAAKLADPRASSAAMATHGFRPGAGQWGAWAFAVLAETALGLGVIAGSAVAAYAAAGLMALFAATLVSALLRGKAGAPCGCLGPRSTVSGRAVAGNVVLGAALAALPGLPDGSPSTDGWLGLGLGVALLACGLLAVAVLALAREVGMLRLRLGPDSALEISHEGPEVGGRTALIERFERVDPAGFALAVFTSAGCRACRALVPAIDSLRSEPELALETFEEDADADVWEALGVPGAPYAIALDLDGTVMAKGTFNNLAQLESIVATAQRRRNERLRVESVGV